MAIRHHYLFLFLVFAFTSSAQNILISDTNFPNETSIVMDPNDPATMIAGANLNNYYISADTGRTWTKNILSSPYGVWGDPVLDVDTAGHFYFFHLSNPPVDSMGAWIDRIVCQKSTDKGENWTDGTYTGLNGQKAQDKQWSIVDRTNNNIYLTWTQFDDYGSSDPQDSSIILFSKSMNGGINWSEPIRLNKTAGDCIDEDNTTEGATPALGPEGELYVCWAGPTGLRFDRSLDQGESWLEEDILIDSMPGGWEYDIPGISRANGLPVTKCDLSDGPNRGTIYVNWSEQRDDPGDTDIWLSKSTDKGNTWSNPIRVNDDPPGKHQFFTWMDVDQKTGYLYFIFYDRRAYENNATDVYLAFSSDGGETFINKKISESPFIPNPGIFFGDYTNIIASNGIIRPIWTRLHAGRLSIWTDLTTIDDLLAQDPVIETIDQPEVLHYPNPAKDIAYVSFKLHKTSYVNLILYDQNGNLVNKIIDNQKMEYGKYIIPVELNKFQLRSGTYYYQLKIDDEIKNMQMILIN